MMKTADSQVLLAAYARAHSEAPFRELVERYIALVYSTAIRVAGGDRYFATASAWEWTWSFSYMRRK